MKVIGAVWWVTQARCLPSLVLDSLGSGSGIRGILLWDTWLASMKFSSAPESTRALRGRERESERSLEFWTGFCWLRPVSGSTGCLPCLMSLIFSAGYRTQQNCGRTVAVQAEPLPKPLLSLCCSKPNPPQLHGLLSRCSRGRAG